MRAELPWNVAGIPPEARDAVRAAARREGLSVGEWMTRRILRSFAMEEDGYARRPAAAADDWDMPRQRRDSDEMMARVGHSEEDSNEAWRRIEDQLRGLDRRLDTDAYGREGTRGYAAPGASVSAKAFDQLGLNVMALHARLERLERSAAHEGVKDAVRALHQGLVHLADQITATANKSATQLLQQSGHLELLAGRVGLARLDGENADKALGQRIDAAEKAAQFNAEALGHALGKIEAGNRQRAAEQAESQRCAAQQAEHLSRLEKSVARLEMELPDSQFERRLESVEQALSGLQPEQFAESDSIQALSLRLAALEKDHADLMAALRARVLRPAAPVEVPAVEFAAPPAPESPPAEELCEPSFNLLDSAPLTELTVAAFEQAPVIINTAEAVDAFTPLAEVQDAAGDTDAAPEPAADFAEIFAVISDAPEETVLDQARHSARAASERAERERRSGFAALRWGQDSAANVDRPKSRALIAVLVAVIVALAAVAALMLSQRASLPAQAAVMPPAHRPVLASAGKAVRLAPRDSAAGNPATLTLLGLRALDGSGGTAVNLPDAVRLLTEAAQKGQAVAQYRLATLYERGQGVAPNPALAARWYQMAAARGNRKAMHNLAVSYANGAAGKKDMTEAARWFAQAAALGLADSQFNLAVLYETGAGVPQSWAQAYKWYAIAASGGDGEARTRSAALRARLSDADRIAADTMAAHFQAAPLNRAANVPPDDLGT
jgi:localization factor PodJL